MFTLRTGLCIGLGLPCNGDDEIYFDGAHDNGGDDHGRKSGRSDYWPPCGSLRGTKSADERRVPCVQRRGALAHRAVVSLEWARLVHEHSLQHSPRLGGRTDASGPQRWIRSDEDGDDKDAGSGVGLHPQFQRQRDHEGAVVRRAQRKATDAPSRREEPPVERGGVLPIPEEGGEGARHHGEHKALRFIRK